jgi:hypothetical protein
MSKAKIWRLCRLIRKDWVIQRKNGCIPISECTTFHFKVPDSLPGPGITRAPSRRVGATPPATLE